MERMNHGFNSKIVVELACDLKIEDSKKEKEISYKTGTKQENAGYFWLRDFMERHPELSLKKPEATTLSPSTSFNRHNVSTFYDSLEGVLQKLGHENVWNQCYHGT
ncbi:hypothetical protein AVEN_19630-1 [Araneus ventricosus]|uniref:HTH CENPB-type domain-containing protein n=1 Tax=Araneus ventricosus TaxID=182803 RepID=A0A4Y2KJK0_ARAVE|nr:hypothetical protein AVEN_19630-1 [Araneus ventricosus]